MNYSILNEDCLDAFPYIGSNIIDSIVTDPPYGLAFMGKKWDHFSSPSEFQIWNEEWASKCLRIIKPGGHMLVFGGTRTYHRLVCGIEDAGFEVLTASHGFTEAGCWTGQSRTRRGR